jgi:hypothetical protein
MEDLLNKIKDRISEKNSPIKTVKGVIDAIGMSEAGFYRMVQRDTIKYGTILALAKALEVDESYFTGSTKQNLSTDEGYSFGADVLNRLRDDMHAMKQLFEEQLIAKDRQIEKLIDLLGKLEGATEGPLSPDYFASKVDTYSDITRSKVSKSLLTN